MAEQQETSSMEGKQEPPVLPVSTSGAEVEPGVNIKVDEAWQVSCMPEEKQYFSQDATLFEAAIKAIKARLDEKDSNIRKSWLLTEIDHWDLEKERVVMLSENNIISVKYNFILGSIEELKFIPLSHVMEMTLGEFKYPSSYGYFRNGRGLKVAWAKDDNVGFLDRWNPLSSRIPHTVFASHLLVRRNKVKDRPELDIETVVPELERAVQEYQRAHGKPKRAVDSGEEFSVKPGDLIVNSLVGLSAMIHNGSNLGFFKRRGVANW